MHPIVSQSGSRSASRAAGSPWLPTYIKDSALIVAALPAIYSATMLDDISVAVHLVVVVLDSEKLKIHPATYFSYCYDYTWS